MGKAPNNSMNPAHIVALGAAIHGGELAGDGHNIILIDVTPLSLGIATVGGKTQIIVLRNTIVPIKRLVNFN